MSPVLLKVGRKKNLTREKTAIEPNNKTPENIIIGFLSAGYTHIHKDRERERERVSLVVGFI